MGSIVSKLGTIGDKAQLEAELINLNNNIENLSIINTESIKNKAPAIEIHTFANVAHGFGVGRTDTNSMLWISLADGFITQIINGIE